MTDTQQVTRYSLHFARHSLNLSKLQASYTIFVLSWPSSLQTSSDFLVISLTDTHEMRIVTNLLQTEGETEVLWNWRFWNFFLSLNVMSNFSFISMVNIISAFRVDFVLVLIDWCGRPLPWHLYLHTVHTHIYELQSWPSQIYMSERFWISWFHGCERKERAMINKHRIWKPSVQGTTAGGAFQAPDRGRCSGEDGFSHSGCGLPSPATIHCGKPLVSCESDSKDLQVFVGCSWDGTGSSIIPWTLDPAGLQWSVWGQSLTASEKQWGWWSLLRQIPEQTFSSNPSLLGRWELCGCILGCHTIVESWWFHPRSRTFVPR